MAPSFDGEYYSNEHGPVSLDPKTGAGVCIFCGEKLWSSRRSKDKDELARKHFEEEHP